MHQQVRTKTTKTGSAGPGAQYDQGGLVDILTLLRDKGVNLRAAGGRDLDHDGEFVFAVHHEDGDDGPAEAAAELLRTNGYDPRVVAVHECLVDDSPGSLLRCIEEAEAKDGDVFEIFVGTPAGGDNRIPIEITTRKGVGGKDSR